MKNRIPLVFFIRNCISFVFSNFSINLSSIFIMFSIFKISKREYSNELMTIILSLKKFSLSYSQINNFTKIPKSFVIKIIQRCFINDESFHDKKKRIERPFKLNEKAKRSLIRYVERNSHDNLISLITSSKFIVQLSKFIVRKYLKSAGYLRYKIRKKFFLINKQRIIRFKWIRKHKHWNMNKWLQIIWIDEIIFEIGLNTRSCYVTRKKKIVMKIKYLKLIFKSGRTTIKIWETITLNQKKFVHILTKKKRMINEVLRFLKFSFYEKCMHTRDRISWMNDEAIYHIFKLIKKFRDEMSLKRIDWSIQSSNLNFIKNLWKIIKIRVNHKRHQIHLIEIMKKIILNEWKALKERDFRKCIKNMSRRCRLIIDAKKSSIKYWLYFRFLTSIFH